MHNDGNTLEDAIQIAVEFCIQNGILVDYLKQNKSEVSKMLFEEYSVEDEIKEAKLEAREEGLEEGRAEGRAEIQKEIILNMFQEGLKIDMISKLTKISLDDVQKICSIHS